MSYLADSLLIKNMKLRNRLALPALTTNYGNTHGEVTGKILDFYRKRSRHVGLVVVEAAAVRADGRIAPGNLGLWEKNQISGMACLVEIIKAQGAVAVIQLNHAGSRCTPNDGKFTGASPSGFRFRPDVEPLVLDKAHIRELVECFADAATRAIGAGFDGVEIHGAHFCMISQFLSPLTNNRQDCYGGDIKGRAKLALEVISAVRERIGPNLALLFRLNGVEMVEGGQTHEDAIELSRLLADSGVDILDISIITNSFWCEENGKRYLVASSAFPQNVPPGFNIEVTESIRNASNIPVIAVGKMADEFALSEVLRGPKADIIAVGRQMIADPHTAEKLLGSQFKEIIKCKECMSCFETIGRGLPMRCPFENY